MIAHSHARHFRGLRMGPKCNPARAQATLEKKWDSEIPNGRKGGGKGSDINIQ